VSDPDSDREKRIQEALVNSAAKWDEKYSQKDWKATSTPRTKVPKARPATKGFARKAMKNVW
jgi:hypothetical protein